MVTTRSMINSLQTAVLPKKNKKNSKRKPGKRHRRKHFSIVRANGQVFKRNIQESVASENNNLRQQLEDVQDFAVFQQLSAETSIQQLQQQNQTLEEQICFSTTIGGVIRGAGKAPKGIMDTTNKNP